eukprot:TRINITY_DN4219_c0_g1_i7.p1 TRINITY_DN4219_c0_g1~~TRINITY_DN4219_c0_g1_i7.p1  ORF type:complete len:524 (-),score=111.78 TRINITY_DN4219_c0_g1_i7:281-1852(-)
MSSCFLEHLLEDGLTQSHFCHWARDGQEEELAKEIEVVLGIRYAIKHAERSPGSQDDGSLSGTSLQRHAEVVQAYRDVLQSRMQRCCSVRDDRCSCIRLLSRLRRHVVRHVERMFKDAILCAANEVTLVNTVEEALATPELVEIVGRVFTQHEDQEAVQWCLQASIILSSTPRQDPLEKQCPFGAVRQIEPYVLRTVTPYHHSSDVGQEQGISKHEFVDLFQHIESEVKVDINHALGPFQASSYYARLKAIEAHDPEKVDSMTRDLDYLRSKGLDPALPSPALETARLRVRLGLGLEVPNRVCRCRQVRVRVRISAGDAVSAGIETLVFDFDKTLVPSHIGKLLRAKVDQVELTPVAQLILLCALAKDFRVGIASFSDCDPDSLGEEYVAGGDMIGLVLKNQHVLGPELAQRVKVVAGHPDRLNKRGVVCGCGHAHAIPYSKHHHLHSICPELATHQIRPSSIMLFDDNMGNTVRARQEGMTGADVDPATAVSFETWFEAMEASQFIPAPEEEKPWSFNTVQQ